ncbi:MAG TPA: carboxymuconolactone decarboxylase family protein [Acidimicrobiales bacterium]|nr:carboxymuconolactone decarboxylase family protein [Acidimicrobiales bacterium]
MTEGDASDRRRLGEATYREVMTVPCVADGTPFTGPGLLDFVFADVWNRPGLSRRDRRLVTLTCVAAADTQAPIEEHVYAALNSGDISYDEALEFVLHFAVYCGWPKASFLNMVVQQQWARICADRGEAPPSSALPVWGEGFDAEERMRGGEACFAWVNCVGAPPRDTPYTQAGILGFVFGEVWQRPHLSVRDRRVMTVAAVGVDDTIIPIRSHVYAALKSGDLTLTEMQELVLHFAVYAGWPKASFLNQVVAESWARIESEGGTRPGEAPAYH